MARRFLSFEKDAFKLIHMEHFPWPSRCSSQPLQFLVKRGAMGSATPGIQALNNHRSKC